VQSESRGAAKRAEVQPRCSRGAAEVPPRCRRDQAHRCKAEERLATACPCTMPRLLPADVSEVQEVDRGGAVAARSRTRHGGGVAARCEGTGAAGVWLAQV